MGAVEETEGRYLAEIPDLPGRGDPLPPQVAAAVADAGMPRCLSEVMVAV